MRCLKLYFVSFCLSGVKKKTNLDIIYIIYNTTKKGQITI